MTDQSCSQLHCACLAGLPSLLLCDLSTTLRLPAGAFPISWSELAGSWGWRRLLFSAVSFWPEGAVTLQTLEEEPVVCGTQPQSRG